MDLTPQALVLLQPALVDDIATDDASALAILNAQNSRKLREQCQAILFLVDSAIKNATNVAYTTGDRRGSDRLLVASGGVSRRACAVALQ